MDLNEKYPDLAFLTAVMEFENDESPWPCIEETPEIPDVSILYVYGFSPHVKPLLEWVEKDSKRDLVFIEDDLSSIDKMLTQGDERVLESDQVHLRYKLEELSVEEFVQEVVRDFPFEHIAFFNVKPDSKLFEQFKLVILRKSVIEASVHNEMLQSHRLFYNLKSNFERLPRAFDTGRWKGKLTDRPAIICGAGPSLQGVIDDLREVDNRAILCAGGSAIVALNAKEVLPHLLFAIDPNVEEFTRLGLHTSFQTPMIYGNRVRPEIFESYCGPAGYLVTGTGGLIETWMEQELGIQDDQVLKGLSDEALSVTCVSLMAAIYFGCNPIIFAGVDLSYGDGKRYPDGVISDLHCSLEEEEHRASELLHVHDGKITATKWIMEKDAISQVIQDHPEVDFIDATGQGLPLKGVKVDKEWKKSLTKVFDPRAEIHQLVMENSLQTTEEEVKKKLLKFQESLVRCDNLIEEILSHLKELVSKGETKSETAIMITLEMDLSEEDGYKLVLAPAAYAWTFPLVKEVRKYKEQSELYLKVALYKRLKTIIADYLRSLLP